MSFDDYAKTWDTDKRINRAKIIADKISNSIDINKDYSAMEFGCGTGLVSFNLYNKFKEITLIDSSKGMIDILNSKINKYKVNNMVINHLDISDGNSLDVKFDVIYNSMVLHHIQNTSSTIKNFYELLNEDGYLCIVDLDEEDGSFHKDYSDFDGHNGFNQEELKNILSMAGFKHIESNTFFYDEKIVEGQKVNYSLFLMKARKYTNP
ncbi:class I SAM-dependent DNA methyltransferase [Clostridium vincentii]|uniref:Bifunctional 3-demethylubiquinone-9 3-methyltransferase/ 2-octaprenyl-6-hydroxy phenol methylase n=1 Tax=Clostridium vincentii TaxID=52704 RepID=A0A2T0BAQ0_9CLOT|nr:class I SAM-dependent methyltransferase [Clostridium vincentii]PRR80954.1 bifunctional 3-demethylubiquinone-9 3-methyltransferase/ 2-octaprenyl-6-hydroxy phenol methylase [Clostridium vincentii]